MQIRLCVRIMFCVCVLLVCPVSLHVLCLSCSTPVMWPRVSRRRSVHAQSPLFTFWILHFLLLFSFITVLIWLQYVNFHIWMKDIKEICEKKKSFSETSEIKWLPNTRKDIVAIVLLYWRFYFFWVLEILI